MKDFTEEELRLLSDVLPNVGNELRDAAAAMRIAMRQLAPEQRQERSPEARQSAAVFMHGYSRMLRLIGNLSEAELLARDVAPALQNLDLAGLCRDVCDEAEALFELKKITLLFESDRPGLVLAADEGQLRRLLLNLLSNALKFTPEGGTVTVRVRDGNSFAHVSVSDTGCGIPPEKLETVFDRFLHAEPLDASPHGLGLGLALCRRIAQLHGGRIVAESAVGKGATFTLSLPKRTAPSTNLRTPRVELAGGLNRTLVELSDALPAAAFTYLHLD